MWGIIPAAGKGSRIQRLAFSKELSPLRPGSGSESPRPRAVSDFLMERMVLAGAKRICFVISSEKSDILQYYGRSSWPVSICYAVQRAPLGLCDAVFQAVPFIEAQEQVLVGLPDTIWFPADGFTHLPQDCLSFLSFPVRDPELFDSLDQDETGRITRIRVKDPATQSNLIWGAFKMTGAILHELFNLWCLRARRDEHIGTLVNEWIARGGEAWGVPAGRTYHDAGTSEGYSTAMRALSEGESAMAAGGKTRS